MAKKIRMTVFFENKIDLKEAIPVFHQWLQEESLPGLPLDVVDYRHVPLGPGVLLVGHDGDYEVREIDGRSALTYSQKRQWPAEANSLTQKIEWVQTRLRFAADLLHRSLGWTTDEETLLLSFPDRLNNPNTPEFAAALGAELSTVWSLSSYRLEWVSDQQEHQLAYQLFRRVERAKA